MPEPTVWLAFVAATLGLLAIPGPVVLFVVGRALAGGRSAGLSTIAGIAVGDLVHVLAAALGISALVASSAELFAVVKWAGVVYLVGLGLVTLRGSDRPAGEPPRSAGRLAGFTVAALNVKTAIFFVAFLPQFVDASRPAALQVLALGSTFVLLGALTNALWATASGAAAERFSG
ncbi:MAG TPA: LysE family translocator, partial [Thermoleophilaceae bacterium]|nr:LysE family translocator [Thermoleophilaceae bacterium]